MEKAILDDLFLQTKYAGYDMETSFDFSKRSSIGCGGKARVAFYPKTIAQCVNLLRELHADGIEYTVVGNMTNVLPPDGEYKTPIVCTRLLKNADGAENGVIPAGLNAAELIKFSLERNQSGMEFLYGIPCTLGGALYMNAGVNGKYIAEIVESVWVYYCGKTLALTQKECEYAYKKSVFMDEDAVILGAKLVLKTSSREEIHTKIEEYKTRRAHLPTGKSMGCVFKNPEGTSAGALIEGAGLKGTRVGGAHISKTHANFIINDKGATSAEIGALVKLIKHAVFAKYKIRLQEEIRYLT